MGGNGDFENRRGFFYFFIYRPEILHTPRGRQCAHSCRTEFWISSPKKFGAPLNFAFALRPMEWKISNRLYSSFRSCFGLIFSGLLGWSCESSLWDFALWEKVLTRFLSIFVCFTPPLIFPEPLKIAHWNFNTPCKYDGANSFLSHSWLAFIGATEGGAKCGVNFGIFKNHSGGPRGGQISTDRSQIYTRGGWWLDTSFFPNNDFWEFPQPVSLSFSGENSRGYIPVTPGYIDIRFAGYVDTLSGCRREFSKSRVTPKCGPQEWSNFQAGPHCGPSGGQIYANIAILLPPFGRTLNPLKNAPYLGYHPLTQFVQGGLENCNFCWMSRFQGDPAQKWCNVLGIFCIGLLESKLLYNF